MQTLTLSPLDARASYCLVPEGGLRLAQAQDRARLDGAQWSGLHAALAPEASFLDALRACAAVASELKPQLRVLLHYHCGGGTLRTRQLMMDLQNL